MKNNSSSPTSSTSTPVSVSLKRDRSSSASLLGNSGYKFWVLSAILLLAFWSMFTGSVSLKWSSGNLTRFSNDVDFSIDEDLDILEVEERKKMVRRMWDVYTHGSNVRLPRFWSEAFEAAYEYLTSDVPGVRDVAVSEIAKMSFRSHKLDSLPVQSKILREAGKDGIGKEADKRKEMITVASS